MYDPRIARFLQEDTYTGDPNDPLSLNLYTYCANNPLIYHDPTGNVYVPLEVPIEYVSKHYNSVKEYELKLQRKAFIEEVWPTYKEDIAKSRLELRLQGWILPLTEEEKEYSNYIFYEHANAKFERKLYGMLDEAKATTMNLAVMLDIMMSKMFVFNFHIYESAIRNYAPGLVNDSSYVEKLMSPFINSGSKKQMNFIERELHDAEMQGRLGFLEFMTILEMGVEEALAAQKIKKASKVLSKVDDTKQFWDELADFFTQNKGNKGTSKTIQVPGRVQSRINISNDGWKHVVKEHFSSKNKSQFTITQDELKSLLQSNDIVKTPVTRTLDSADGIRYVREIDVGYNIGIDKFNNFQPTSIMTILTDKYGNLVTTFPGVIK